MRGAAVLGATVALLLVWAAISATPAQAAGPKRPPIDLTAAVDGSTCMPCHARLTDAVRPGLFFSHGKHLLVSCSACHSQMPHQDGMTWTPPMDLCFNCHGVQHGGSGELASSTCASCHPKTFKLRPASHGKDWNLKPHATASKAGANRCMMCHDAPKDCDVCHKKQGVKVAAMPAQYHPVYAVAPKQPAVNVNPEGPVSMGQCVYCHPDVDAFLPGRLIFAHATHIQRDYPCAACHEAFPHNPLAVQKPNMESCYRCHGLKHASSGLVAPGDECGKCHPKTFKLRPPDHTKAFATKTHKDRAYRDPGACAMCHSLDYCFKCHRGKVKLATGTMSATIVPAAHKKPTWRPKHGGEYRTGGQLCGACHESQECLKCHTTPMPHPSTWLAKHNVKTDKEKQDCAICHTDRTRCNDCHHGAVKSAELVLSSCVKCHKEMRTSKPTGIKNKTIAEHAVHFQVAKKKGEPYSCDECHIDFGSVDMSSRKSTQRQAHDLRLCYSCHGALDYRDRLIAPYPGAELCRRCHTDLSI